VSNLFINLAESNNIHVRNVAKKVLYYLVLNKKNTFLYVDGTKKLVKILLDDIIAGNLDQNHLDSFITLLENNRGFKNAKYEDVLDYLIEYKSEESKEEKN